MKTIKETKALFNSYIKNPEPFYFVRFGDGDLTLMKGANKEQRHKNSPMLTKELREALNIVDAGYHVSSTAGSFNDGSGSYFWIKRRDLRALLDNDLRKIWQELRGDPDEGYHALIFQYTFEKDPLWFIKFVEEIFYDKKTLLIAGEPLCNKPLIEKMFNVTNTISFKGVRNAYYELDNKMDLILEKISECDIILPVVGMATRVLAKRLWQDYQIRDKYLIDIGVTMDALAEAQHRGWTSRVVAEGVVNNYKDYFGVGNE